MTRSDEVLADAASGEDAFAASGQAGSGHAGDNKARVYILHLASTRLGCARVRRDNGVTTTRSIRTYGHLIRGIHTLNFKFGLVYTSENK